MTLEEILAARERLLTEARALLTTGTVTNETRTRAEQMIADAETMRRDAQNLRAIDEAQRAAQRQSVAAPRDPVTSSNTNTDLSNDPAERRQQLREIANREVRAVFAAASNRTAMPTETRALTLSADGTFFVPQTIGTPAIARMSYGYVYSMVDRIRTSDGAPMRPPLIDDVNNGFVLNSTAIATTDPTIGQAQLLVDDLRMNPILLDNSLIQDTQYDIVSFLRKASASRYLRSVSKAISQGNGSNIGGLSGFIGGVLTGTIGVIKYADLVALYTGLDPAYLTNAVWRMSQATLGVIMNIVDSYGRPIFLPFTDGANTGFPGALFGFPVKIDPYLPAVASGNYPIQFGDHELGYQLREVSRNPDVPNDGSPIDNINFRVLNELYATTNQTAVVAFARVGGTILNPGGLVAGNPAPITALKVQ